MPYELLKTIKIPLRPIEEQRMIVLIFDELKQIIEKKQRQLGYINEAIRARYVELFGDPGNNIHNWSRGTIADVVSDVKYGTSKPSVEGGQYKYLRMGNITDDGYLDLTDLKYIDVDEIELKKYGVTSGDVLFNRTNSGDKVGKTCVYDLEEQMVIAGYLIRVRVNEKVTPHFLSAHLNSLYGKAMLKKITKNSICQSNINAKELQSIPILLPPIELQKEFDTFVKQMSKSINDLKKQLYGLNELYNALESKYFNISKTK